MGSRSDHYPRLVMFVMRDLRTKVRTINLDARLMRNARAHNARPYVCNAHAYAHIRVQRACICAHVCDPRDYLFSSFRQQVRSLSHDAHAYAHIRVTRAHNARPYVLHAHAYAHIRVTRAHNARPYVLHAHAYAHIRVTRALCARAAFRASARKAFPSLPSFSEEGEGIYN